MIHSLFMLGGSYNKDRKFSIIFILCWIIYMFSVYDFSLGYIFPIINAFVCFSVIVLISLIKNRKLNTILSIGSVLIWSIIIDIICYFMYPSMTGGQNIILYIYQGILFNYKYIFTNIIAVCFINIVIMIKKIIVKKISTCKYKEVLNNE